MGVVIDFATRRQIVHADNAVMTEAVQSQIDPEATLACPNCGEVWFYVQAYFSLNAKIHGHTNILTCSTCELRYDVDRSATT